MIRFLLILTLISSLSSFAQTPVTWKNVDSLYGPLPSSVHVYFTDSRIDTGNFRAYYLVADLKDKQLDFSADTSRDRRLTPSEFFEKNNQPLVVVNTTFFSFETNRNLNVVIKDGKLVSYNQPNIPGRGKDTLTYRHTFPSAIGIDKKRKADVVWTLTDSVHHLVYASQMADQFRDSTANPSIEAFRKRRTKVTFTNEYGTKEFPELKKWNVQTAVGGGPVLIQDGEVVITNGLEWKFPGKAIHDKHPRTAMGYTAKNEWIILVIEGRNPQAGGANLEQEAQILKDLGCVEALNLDGGGSSCLLINGKETISPSDKKQRAVPAVFVISRK